MFEEIKLLLQPAVVNVTAAWEQTVMALYAVSEKQWTIGGFVVLTLGLLYAVRVVREQRTMIAAQDQVRHNLVDQMTVLREYQHSLTDKLARMKGKQMA